MTPMKPNPMCLDLADYFLALKGRNIKLWREEMAAFVQEAVDDWFAILAKRDEELCRRTLGIEPDDLIPPYE